MVSKYDLRWIRKRAGHYILQPNGNYEIIKRHDGWAAYYFDLWIGKRREIGDGIPTYDAAKKVVMAHLDSTRDRAIKRLGK